MEFEDYKKELFKRWHSRIQRVCWAMAISTLVLEVAVFVLYLKTDQFDISPAAYFLAWVLLPSLINFSFATIATYAVVSRNMSIKRKNYMVCFCFLVTLAVAAIFHNHFTMVLVFPCFAVLMSAVFSDKRLTLIITLGSFIALIPALYIWVGQNLSLNIVSLIISCVISVLVLAGFYFVARMMIRYNQEQVEFIYDAFTRQQELIEELNIEPMTKLYNKTALNDCLKLYIQKFLNKEFVPHLVLLDIDHFKTVNDVYGHNAGDTVLLRLSELIRSKMGGSRRAFRFGGDEMVLLFGNETLEQIKEIVEELRLAFKNTQYDFNPKDPITLSVGIAAYYKGLTEKSWFELVDSTMYKSKTEGRDKVYIA